VKSKPLIRRSLGPVVDFRVDASIDIGTGHVMRCLTLSKELGNVGVRCRFICRPHDGNMLDEITAHGFTTLSAPIADRHPGADEVNGLSGARN
jgi:hypothetical protein